MSTPGPQRFVGKVALVTGAASGIGKAAAQRLVEEGAKVALADLDQPEAARVAESIRADGGQALALRLDVRSEPDWQAAMDRILAECGRLDISVHSAGVAFAKPIMELDLADWRRVMSTNLDGVFLGTRQAMRAMKEGGGGCIINIASAAGIKPLAGNAAYGTSKAAIRFFTRVAALEGAPHRIRVNSISPRCGRDADVGIHGFVAPADRHNGRSGRGFAGVGDRSRVRGAGGSRGCGPVPRQRRGTACKGGGLPD